MKKRWANPDCQNSEPTKRTVSISAMEREGDKIKSKQASKRDRNLKSATSALK